MPDEISDAGIYAEAQRIASLEDYATNTMFAAPGSAQYQAAMSQQTNYHRNTPGYLDVEVFGPSSQAGSYNLPTFEMQTPLFSNTFFNNIMFFFLGFGMIFVLFYMAKKLGLFTQDMITKEERDLLERAKRALGIDRHSRRDMNDMPIDPEQMNRVAQGPNAFNLEGMHNPNYHNSNPAPPQMMSMQNCEEHKAYESYGV